MIFSDLCDLRRAEFPRCCLGGAQYGLEKISGRGASSTGMVHQSVGGDGNPSPAPTPARAPLLPWQLNDCNDVDKANFTHMGVTMRTPRWRYTRWMRWDGAKLLPRCVTDTVI